MARNGWLYKFIAGYLKFVDFLQLKAEHNFEYNILLVYWIYTLDDSSMIKVKEE